MCSAIHAETKQTEAVRSWNMDKSDKVEKKRLTETESLEDMIERGLNFGSVTYLDFEVLARFHSWRKRGSVKTRHVERRQ